MFELVWVGFLWPTTDDNLTVHKNVFIYPYNMLLDAINVSILQVKKQVQRG